MMQARKQKRYSQDDDNDTLLKRNNKLTLQNEALNKELKRVKKRLMMMSKEKNILMDKLLAYSGKTEINYIPVLSTPPEARDSMNEKPQKKLATESLVHHTTKQTPSVKLPIRMGILTLHSLGKISLLPSYHNQQYIWPIGYKISRTYLSIVNPSGNTTYVCSIEDNGHAGPKFQIIAEDCPHHTIIGNSATEVWTIIVRRANEIRNNPYSGTASGPDYYGLTQPVITQMIQDLPNANQCKNYIWKHFDKMFSPTSPPSPAIFYKKNTLHSTEPLMPPIRYHDNNKHPF